MQHAERHTLCMEYPLDPRCPFLYLSAAINAEICSRWHSESVHGRAGPGKSSKTPHPGRPQPSTAPTPMPAPRRSCERLVRGTITNVDRRAPHYKEC